jgi:mannose-6-phosphate isomerase-like protein (cupin superfamily)
VTIAPDGALVEVLALSPGCQLARFVLAAGRVTRPVRHRTVEELWYVSAGTGRLWLGEGDRDAVHELSPGVAAVIRRGTSFQWRADPDADLEILGVTMPPWPGDDEAQPAEGPWQPTV